MNLPRNENVIGQIVRTIVERRVLIIVVFLFVVISGMAATAMITPRFEANMSLLVSRDRAGTQVTATDKGPVIPTEISDEEFNSELELIKSSEVIAGVVRDLDLANDQKPVIDSRLAVLRGKIKAAIYGLAGRKSDAGGEDIFTVEQLVNKVSERLVVTSNKKSRVIKVTYSDTDPVRGKKVLEKLYERYLELHIQINTRPNAGQVFDEQTEKFNGKLSKSTNALKQFDTQNGVTGAEIGVQRELLLRQLYETQAQANAARTGINEAEKRIADLKLKVAAQPEQIQTGSVSKYVAALDKMKEEMAQLQQQRTQLLQKYQPNSRFVRENQERIDQLKKSIAEETANPPLERTYALNDLRRRLESELSNSQTELAALRERGSNLTVQADKLRSQVEVLNTKSIERANLERDRNVNEEAYLLYEKKTRENEITQVLNRERSTNLTVVDPPRTDGIQKNPKPLLNFLILAAIGLAAGFVGALVLDRYGRNDGPVYVASRHELESRLDLPLLASIPAMTVRRSIMPPTNGRTIEMEEA